jgi:hypothetical protein
MSVLASAIPSNSHDLFAEGLIPLNGVKHLPFVAPGRRGKKRDDSVIYRWAFRGVRGIRLEKTVPHLTIKLICDQYEPPLRRHHVVNALEAADIRPAMKLGQCNLFAPEDLPRIRRALQQHCRRPLAAAAAQ